LLATSDTKGVDRCANGNLEVSYVLPPTHLDLGTAYWIVPVDVTGSSVMYGAVGNVYGDGSWDVLDGTPELDIYFKFSSE
jgi:hypothetical protein